MNAQEDIKSRLYRLYNKYSHGNCLCGHGEHCEACDSGSLFNSLRMAISEIINGASGITSKDYKGEFMIPATEAFGSAWQQVKDIDELSLNKLGPFLAPTPLSEGSEISIEIDGMIFYGKITRSRKMTEEEKTKNGEAK